MDQCVIVLYLARKGLTAVEICEHLLATLGAEVINSSSVTRHLREAKFATSNPEVTFSEPIRKRNDCDQAILPAPKEQPFTSMRKLAWLTPLPRTTVSRGLPQSLGFQVRHL
jgi:hypothetical protein